MPQGRVKWFNDSKGYGFINDEAHDEDIFVHYSQIQQEGFKTLEAGESVDFKVKESPKGLRAEEVQRLKEEAREKNEE